MSDINLKEKRVDWLRQEIIKLGVSHDEVDEVKGKAALVNLYQSLQQSEQQSEQQKETSVEDMIEEIEPAPFELEIKNDGKEIEMGAVLSRHSPGWSNHVLGHLREDEKDTDAKGNPIPKTDGLKRLVEELVGYIVDIDNTPIQFPSPDNQFMATVKSRVSVVLEDNSVMTYTGIADCKRSDCPPPYDKFVSAIAETRAEGRAYRKILALKNVATSEEIIGADKKGEEFSDIISESQISFVNMMCGRERLNINIQQTFHTVTEKQYNDIYRYNQEEAYKVISILNRIQADESKKPEGIGGYDPNWKDYFCNG